MIQSFENWAGKLSKCDNPDWWHERLGLWTIAWTESQNAEQRIEECWIPIEEAEIGTNQHAWLVRVKSSPLAAMGVLVGPETWKVQPLFSKWYIANDVTHVFRMAQ